MHSRRDRDDDRHLTDYMHLREDIMQQVSDRFETLASIGGLLLLIAGILLYVLGHGLLGGASLHTGTTLTFLPRAVASYRYLRTLDAKSAWWLLRSDHNATLVVTSSIIPMAVPFAALGLAVAALFNNYIAAALFFLPAAAVFAPCLYLVLLHRREMIADFLHSIRTLRHAIAHLRADRN